MPEGAFQVSQGKGTVKL
jgi:hypothetical protein